MSRTERQYERVKANIPVELEGMAYGETVNLSPAGLFFLTDADVMPGKSVHLVLEFDSPAGDFSLDCVGDVVRVEDARGKHGVAVTIRDSRLARRGNGQEH